MEAELRTPLFFLLALHRHSEALSLRGFCCSSPPCWRTRIRASSSPGSWIWLPSEEQMSLLFSFSLLIQTEAKLYRSVIEDVIEGVRDLFAEEGVEEEVLKDLKQLWETKVLQSKATEDFFRNSVHSPLFTLQLPHSLHQTLQSSAASFVIPAGRTRPSFTAAELGTSNSSASFTFPGYPIHVPVGVTQQTTSAHLCKVSVPFMVTQTSERANVLQHPVQQVFQLLGQPSIIQTSIPQLNPCFLQATTEKSLRMETVLQQPIVLPSETVDKKHLENTTSDILVPPGNEHKIISEALLNQLDSSSQMDLSIRVTDGDVNEIIQIGGTGDTSSNDEIGNTRDVDENGLLGIIDAGDLKVTEEETGRVSNEDSSVNSSDNEDPEIDLLEEDPLNSGDDVSEQDVPDLFDMDNVIVCQYDKIHRSKDKWKFYLKDGVMCFGGRDYVFAKAIGDAEW
ncbi:TFIIA-alpha and beta-like factor isoform X2 [Bubalus kerabau]|uniref:TFIIA-alpha and beta-like factor isoform X2 n=1 Tax=Bubalus carabanensis TaxID=3119969 RepID=UPI00244E7220|nr:TFIIA-alpha and beta-like factor isoform X2 [Bubalus carabanensis]